MEDEVLCSLSRKLGITDSKVIKRAAELSRLAGVRCVGSGNSLSLSGSAKSIICLEMAAVSCSVPLEKASVIRLSGMNKKAYTNAYKALECVLGEQKSYSVQDLAVQFGCLEAVKNAENLLQRYTDESVEKLTVDPSQPIFAASALYAICRYQKIKIDKSKLVNLLGIKRSMFDKLCQDMEKLIPLLEGKSSKDHLKRPRGVIDKLNDAVEEECRALQSPQKYAVGNAVTDTDYEEWKRRIIEAATAAINKDGQEQTKSAKKKKK